MTIKPIRKIFVANRGEIALRIIKTARKMGLLTAVPVIDEEREGEVAQWAHEVFYFTGQSLTDTFLNIETLTEMALKAGSDAVHPGYGFLSENETFAKKTQEAGLIWIGPSPAAIAAMGNKQEARRLAIEAGIPVTRGATGTPREILEQQEHLPWPLLIKPTAGGGGKGMKIVHSPRQLEASLEEASREALNYFGDAQVFAEQYLDAPRHVEVQVLGDEHGNLVHLFERECSVQRRYQKVIEEAPSPAVSEQLREKLTGDALKLCRQISYHNAGTIEFLVDKAGQHYFLEMNTRIQVEHPVTEAITGIDLIEQQIRVAMGQPLAFSQQDIAINGHALEARVYAEDALNNFAPSPGTIHLVQWPDESHARTDTFFHSPTDISPLFDPLLAKIITHDSHRNAAIHKMHTSLEHTFLLGTTTNLPLLKNLFANEHFYRGLTDTHFIQRHQSHIADRMQPNGKGKTTLLLAAYAAWHTLFRPVTFTTIWGRTSLKRWAGKTEVKWNRQVYTLFIREVDPSNTLYWNLDGKDLPPLEKIAINPDEHELTFWWQNRFYKIKWIQLSNHELLLAVDGYTYRFEPGYAMSSPQKYEKNSSPNGRKPLQAPIPGRIAKILVKPGEQVSQGTPILVLEAMKMENHLMSDAEATVKKITVSEGEQVKAGQELTLFDYSTKNSYTNK